jgi:Tfp pilus assembly protein PilV
VLIRPRHEQGFTLVELLVAALIGMVVIGVSVKMLLGGIQGSQQAGTNRRAQAEANRVLDELGTDLRSAAAPERLDVNDASTRSKLRLGVMAISASVHAYEDISQATSTSLAFRADAIAEPAGQNHKIECVQWRVQNGGEFNLLVRRVWTSSAACPGSGTAMTRTVTKLYKTSNEPVFRYTVAQPVPNAPDPVCQPVTLASVPSPSQRTRIVGVQVNLRGVVRDSQVLGGLDTSGVIDVWSRLTGDYQYAIGCSA